MSCPIRLAPILSVLLVTIAVSLDAAEGSGRKGFVNGWQGRRVVLKQTLYSIVYDERSRFLPPVKKQGRVRGMTVDSGDVLIERDPNRVVSILRSQYRRSMHLDLGSVQDVEPLMLVRYDPGVELIVGKVQIERDHVRLSFRKDLKADIVTTLTVKWPVPLSNAFTESSLIDDLLVRFVDRR